MSEHTGCAAAANERAGAIEVVLFDLDGTLIDTIDLILASMRHATDDGSRRGAPGRRSACTTSGVPLRVQMEEFDARPRRGAARRLPGAQRDRPRRAGRASIPGIEDGAQALAAQGYRLAIVTSKSRPVAQRGLDDFGLGDFFETRRGLRGHGDPQARAGAAARGGRAHGRADRALRLRRGQPARHERRRSPPEPCRSAALWGPFAERVLEPGPAVALERSRSSRSAGTACSAASERAGGQR